MLVTPEREREDLNGGSTADLRAHTLAAAPDNVHALAWALAPCKFAHGGLHLRIKAVCAKIVTQDHRPWMPTVRAGEGRWKEQEDKGAS